MSKRLSSITIHLNLTSYGDALIYGTADSQHYIVGLDLKQRLFAWHAASFYGTELEIQQVQDVELILLPAEQVIPFFAEERLLEHLEWRWEEQAAQLREWAPVLNECLKAKQYIPDYSACRNGAIGWTWDTAAADPKIREIIDAPSSGDDGFAEGVRAAFSAAVRARYYNEEAAAADLRREYPLLFANEHAALSGLDEQAWLMAIGWKADHAPFRPALQLVEPEEAAMEMEDAWKLQLVLQDKRTPSVLIPLRLSSTGEAFGAWPAEWSPAVRERSAGWLKRLRACLPAEQLGGSADDLLNAPMDANAAWQFLSADSPRLLEAGWLVLLPAWWEAISKKKPRLRAKISSEAAGSRNSLFGLDSLVEFDWRIAIGETDLTEEEFAELAARNERLIRVRGQWISLDPSLLLQIRKIMAGMDRAQGLSFQDVLQLHLLGQDDVADPDAAATPEGDERVRLEVELNGHLLQLMNQLSRQAEWPALPAPAALRAELRPYQQEGYAWLAFMRRLGLGACLADDMGLGKTIQLIAYLIHVKEADAETGQRAPSLIICPTSVLGNWQKELNRFAPSLEVITHYGSKRLEGEELHAAARHADVVLTSYATATLDQELLNEMAWSALCLDEAQNIKNAQTKQSSAVRGLTARHRIALTGTPIENRLAELWSIYDFINPAFLGSAHGFQKRFAQPIEKERDVRKTAELQKLVKPFMLRRKKNDPAIQLDLPEKNEMKTYVHLTPEQGALYNQTVNQLLERMQKLEGIERKGAILSAITQLKQICDHPGLLTKEPQPETAAEAIDVEALISRSSKLERLLAMVKELREEGERCLIFTQYIGMGQMLQNVLRQELEETVLYLNGSTPKTARDRMIAQFQSVTLPPVEQPGIFILSIKAGGVGLNLTAANHVFHFDRWWNPAVENQATDRAYRIGQTRDVQVHKFISLGTLEERIDEMLEHKQQLSEDVIASSEGWITELSTEELKELFTLRQEWGGI